MAADAIMAEGGEDLPARAGFARGVERLTRIWALLGGLVLLAVVLINTVSVAGAFLAALPVPGDFELTEMGVCVAAFAFLPYCQMSGANVTADIFTQNASRRWRSGFALAGSLVALCFALLLLWRMEAGMEDQMDYGYVTTILQVPHWWAFLPILVSLALLTLAAAVTSAEGWRGAAGR